MARRRRQASSGVGIGLLLLMFLAPPAANVILHEIDHRREDSDAAPAMADRVEKLERENAILRERLGRARHDVEVLESYDPAYSPRPVRALPVGDARPGRPSFWVATRDGAPLGSDQAIVSRGALVGRVVRPLAGTAVALVQSIADPAFVVRFRLGEAWGFLRGTGESDPETGKPLLDIQLISAEVELVEGARLFTDGGDGIFPRGMLIGSLIPSLDGEPGRYQVRAALPADGRVDLVALVDRDVVFARRAEARRGEEGGQQP